MALCALCSTIDSCYCAFSSLYACELSKSENKIKSSRLAMLTLSIFGIGVALLKIPIIIMWMFTGLIRISNINSILKCVMSKTFSSKKAVFSIIISFLISAPVFAYGSFYHSEWIKTQGLILCLIIGGFICFLPFPSFFKKLSGYSGKSKGVL